MLANSSTFVTETMSEATKRTTDNAEVHDMLDGLAVPNRTTPTLEPPGPAIGILRKLLPHPVTTALVRHCCPSQKTRSRRRRSPRRSRRR